MNERANDIQKKAVFVKKKQKHPPAWKKAPGERKKRRAATEKWAELNRGNQNGGKLTKPGSEKKDFACEK